MTTWKKDLNWIGAEDFKENPLSANITAVERAKGRYDRDECILTLRLHEGLPEEDTKQFSVFKRNLNWLIEHFGGDDAKWIGRTITLKASNPSGSKLIKELV